uniref:Enkurin domain-containing protein n=1 Tax=Glossina austeni TaxID=7395 RepID=A0A1A9UGJ3_GLOAU
MAARTTASTSTLRTLHGLFELPKMNHRRDFLRENRLNLKELQRTTTNKLIQNKLEQEKMYQQYTPKNQRPQEQYIMNRRSASQHRIVLDGNENLRGRTMLRDPQLPPSRRSCSIQRQPTDNGLPKQQQQPNFVHDNERCCLNPESSVKCPRNSTGKPTALQSDSCDKEIQTEDICDEVFLYEALKKCSSSELNDKSQGRSLSSYANQQRIYENDRLRNDRIDYNNGIHTNQIDNEDSKSQDSIMQQPEIKSKNICADADTRSLQSYHAQEIRSKQNFQNLDNISLYTLSSKVPSHLLNNVYMQKSSPPPAPAAQYPDDDYEDKLLQSEYIDQNVITAEQEGMQSARSRHTVCSQLSKKSSTGSIQKFGARDDVRLPRYLEKEKRGKEEERLKELSRDTNCPIGHYTLSEEERIMALNNAKKKMSSLVQELNHMPMTTETLRIRNRKREIEKELTKIELDIRLFSKSKVYIPLPESQS